MTFGVNFSLGLIMFVLVLAGWYGNAQTRSALFFAMLIGIVLGFYVLLWVHTGQWVWWWLAALISFVLWRRRKPAPVY